MPAGVEGSVRGCVRLLGGMDKAVNATGTIILVSIAPPSGVDLDRRSTQCMLPRNVDKVAA